MEKIKYEIGDVWQGKYGVQKDNCDWNLGHQHTFKVIEFEYREEIACSNGITHPKGIYTICENIDIKNIPEKLKIDKFYSIGYRFALTGEFYNPIFNNKKLISRLQYD